MGEVSPVRLRPMNLADVGPVMALETALFPEDAWSQRTLLGELSGPGRHYVVAEAAGPATAEPEIAGSEAAETAGPQVAGSGTAESRSESGGEGGLAGYAGLYAHAHEGWVQTLAVAPGMRGRGVGRALLAELLAEARRRGATRISLEVREDNPRAQKLYTGFGFTRVGVRHGYYGGADAVVMRRAEEAGDGQEEDDR